MSTRTGQLLRWAFWITGLVAFIWVLRAAEPSNAIPLLLTSGPWLALALVPYLGQIALDALAGRTLLVATDRRVPWGRLIAIRLAAC